MNKLVVVWKSDNDIDIEKFILPYVYNSKVQGWFDEVELLIWGASQEKVMNTPAIIEQVRNIMKSNIRVLACKMCADSLGASPVLIELGVEVIYTGVYLSESLLDSNTKVITL